MSWTDERVNLLKQMWGEGKTAAEIAKLLGGVTRNAVIGKAHRLKLSGRISPIQQNTRPETVISRSHAPSTDHRVTRVVRERVIADVVSPPVMEDYIPGEGVKLVELKERMCRWPLGDPKDEAFRFCGHVAVEGLPYCDHHCRAAFQVNTRGKIKIEELAKIDGDVIRKTVNS